MSDNVIEALTGKITELETELTAIRERRDKEIQAAKDKYKADLKAVTKKLASAKRMLGNAEKL